LDDGFLMPTMYKGFGVEEVVDDLEIVLTEQLNDAILVVSERLAARDEARAIRRGIPYVPLEVPTIPPANFHTGSIPAFVQQSDRAAQYPMVAIVPGRVAPAAESASMDQYDIFQDFVSVHAFALASPAEGGVENMTENAYRRAVRYAEAIYYVMRTDRKMRSLLSGLSNPMQALISEPWLFPEGEGEIGEDWCWQAAGTEYQIKNAAMGV
jgi:hypothetical protein